MLTFLAGAVGILVFCAPGFPGAAADAAPLLDHFAGAAVAAAGWPAGSLQAVYEPTEEGGLARLSNADAVLAFVPYPFLVQHAAQLHLTPIAQANVTDVGTSERWTLMAKSGRVRGPASIAGYTLVSVAGYAPDFVRHSALTSWALPADVKIEPTAQVLSALRRVTSGEPVVVLLDQTQTAAIATLPFAGELKAVVQSPELPVAVIAVVDSRLPASRTQSLQSGFLNMGHAAAAMEVLAPLHLRGFVLPQLPAGTPKS
jgi:hypothetical protein